MEFQKRHEVNKARATEEEDRKMAMKQASAKRPRRGEQIADNVYMSEDLTEEEQKDPHVIKLEMKPYNAEMCKTTAFFSDYTPEQFLKELVDSLEKNGTPYEISNKTWKLTYTKTREEEKKDEATEPEIVIKEQAIV